MRGNSKKKKNIGRTIFCILFGFLLSVFLTIVSILIAIRIGFLNKEVILRCLDSVDFYNQVQAEIYTQISYEIIPTGLELNLIDETIPIEKVHNDVNSYIEACFDDVEYTIETAEIENAIYENIMDQFENMERQEDTGTQEHARRFVSNIIEKYPDIIKFPYMKEFASVCTRIDPIISMIMIAAAVMGAVCILFLLLLQRWKHRSLRYIIYAGLAAALMTVAIPVYLLIQKTYEGLGIRPAYLYNFCMEYIKASLLSFIWIGVGLLGSSILLMIVVKLMKERLKKRKHR